MIKLISQFDNEKMRASVATPTCGPCCSCCCCCIVTTLASSIITARNFGKAVENMQKSDEAEALSNQEIEIDNTNIKMQKRKAYLLGFFLLPVAVGLGFLIIISDIENFIVATIAILAIFGGGLYMLKNKYNIPTRKVALIFILTLIAFIAEFFIWLYATTL